MLSFCWRTLRALGRLAAPNDSALRILVLRCGNSHEWHWREGEDRLETRPPTPDESLRWLDA